MKRIKVTSPQARIQTSIELPSSKSICNRALIISALSKSAYNPENLSDCDDTRVMVEALNNMPDEINIMAAGTAMRFLTAYLSVSEGTHTITGTKRMQQRPISILVDALRTLGADIEYVGVEGFPPLRISGKKLTENEVTLPGNVSSQYISALLMIGPMLENGLDLTLTGDIVSRPYINMTLKLMQEFGARAIWTDENHLRVEAGPYKPIPYFVESDWSAASYWYEICALSEDAEICLPGLFRHSLQGDHKVADLFSNLGVETIFNERGVTLKKTAVKTERMDYDFVNQPDLAQTFVVTCALLGIPFRFEGLHNLKIKETDRITALIAEMKKLGYQIEEKENAVLSWDGNHTETAVAPAIDTYEDHRMAMAFAPACMRIKDLYINNPEVVSKSYPHYWENLTQAGFDIIMEGQE